MKRCFSTLGCHDRSLDEILTLASDHFVDALEVRGIAQEIDNLKIAEFTPEHSEATKTKLKEAKVVPLILGTSCKFHDPEKRSSMIHRACDEVLIAKRLGFRAIRVFGNLITEDEQNCIASVGQAIDEVCAFAKVHGVQVYLEVHGDFNTIDRLNQLMKQIVHKESFGLIWDIYHTHHVYGKNWKQFYEAMKSNIRHVHLKDAVGTQLVLPGKGELEIVPIVKHLLQDGYDGYFSLEWERKWCPELPELKEALVHLDEILKDAV